MRLKDYIIVAGAVIALALVLKTFVLEVVRIPSSSMENALLPGDYVVVNKLVHGSSPDPVPSLAASFFRIPPVRTLRSGDVVVFRLPVTPPGDRDHPLFVKRCVAVPGDTIAVDRSILSVNRHPVAGVTQTSEFVSKALLSESLILPGRGDTLSLIPETMSRWSDLLKAEGHEMTLHDNRVLLDGVRTDSYILRQNYYFMLGDNVDHSYDSRAWGLLPENMIEGTAAVVYWSVDQSDQSGSPGIASIRWNRIGHFIQ
jgi:signal peptidase I